MASEHDAKSNELLMIDKRIARLNKRIDRLKEIRTFMENKPINSDPARVKITQKKPK